MWIKATEKLPPINSRVIACWGYENNVSIMEYGEATVYKKKILRWKYQGSKCPWEIIYWMEIPKPPSKE